MLTDEQITKAAFKYHELTGAHHSTFHSGATWANDQNAARIAELEARLSQSAFNLDGHIILLQAANQQIEKERKKIAGLEAQKAELILLLQEVGFTAPMGSQYPKWIDTLVKIRKAIEKYDPAK